MEFTINGKPVDSIDFTTDEGGITMRLGYGLWLGAQGGGGPQTHIILALGQSNMVSLPNDDGTAWPANVWALNPETGAFDNVLTQQGVSPNTPVHLPRAISNTGAYDDGAVSIAKYFAIELLTARPDDSVILVPVALGGTGFTNDNWDAETALNLAAQAITLTNTAIAAYPSAAVLCAIMQHGEKDMQSANLSYGTQLSYLIANTRDGISQPNLPFIIGEPGAWLVTVEGAAGVTLRDQMREIPTYMPYTATAQATDPAGYAALADTGDDLHFDNPSLALLGGMHHDALTTAQANTAPDPGDTHLLALRTYTSSEGSTTSFAAGDVVAGDVLLILQAGFRGSGTLDLSSLTVNGQTTTEIIADSAMGGTRLIGLAASRVTVATTPTDGILNLVSTWSQEPVGRATAVWRLRGDFSAQEAGSSFTDRTVAGFTGTLTDRDVVGQVFALSWIVDTGGARTVSWSGATEIYDAHAENTSHFVSVAAGVAAGASVTVSATPSATAQSGGMIAVAIADA